MMESVASMSMGRAHGVGRARMWARPTAVRECVIVVCESASLTLALD